MADRRALLRRLAAGRPRRRERAPASATMQSGLRLWLTSFTSLAAGEVVASALRFVALAWVARALGPAAFATVAVGAVIGGYLVVFPHSGLETIGVREIAAEPADASRRLGQIVGVRLALGVACYGLVVVTVLALPLDADTRLVVIVFAVMVVTSALDVRWSFIGIQRTTPVALGSVTAAVAYVVGVLVLVRGSDDLVAVPVVHVAAECAFVAVLLAVAWRRFGPWRPRLERAASWATLAAGTPITLARAARALTVSIDVVLARMILSSNQAGHYAAASRFTLVGIVYLGLYYNAFLPTVVRSRLAGGGELQEVVRLALSRVVRVGPPVAVVATLAAPPVVSLLLGPRYEPTAALLQVLVWSLVLLAFTGVYSSVLLAVRAQRRVAQVHATALAVNVACNLALLPTIGPMGASVATVVAEATSLGLSWAAARPFLRPGP